MVIRSTLSFQIQPQESVCSLLKKYSDIEGMSKPAGTYYTYVAYPKDCNKSVGFQIQKYNVEMKSIEVTSLEENIVITRVYEPGSNQIIVTFKQLYSEDNTRLIYRQLTFVEPDGFQSSETSKFVDDNKNDNRFTEEQMIAATGEIFKASQTSYDDDSVWPAKLLPKLVTK